MAMSCGVLLVAVSSYAERPSSVLRRGGVLGLIHRPIVSSGFSSFRLVRHLVSHVLRTRASRPCLPVSSCRFSRLVGRGVVLVSSGRLVPHSLRSSPFVLRSSRAAGAVWLLVLPSRGRCLLVLIPSMDEEMPFSSSASPHPLRRRPLPAIALFSYRLIRFETAGREAGRRAAWLSGHGSSCLVDGCI